VNVWLYLEDIPKDTAAADISGYANAWSAQVKTADMSPGLISASMCG
jgi:hypothetical protein